MTESREEIKKLNNTKDSNSILNDNIQTPSNISPSVNPQLDNVEKSSFEEFYNNLRDNSEELEKILGKASEQRKLTTAEKKKETDTGKKIIPLFEDTSNAEVSEAMNEGWYTNRDILCSAGFGEGKHAFNLTDQEEINTALARGFSAPMSFFLIFLIMTGIGAPIALALMGGYAGVLLNSPANEKFKEDLKKLPIIGDIVKKTEKAFDEFYISGTEAQNCATAVGDALSKNKLFLEQNVAKLSKIEEFSEDLKSGDRSDIFLKLDEVFGEKNFENFEKINELEKQKQIEESKGDSKDSDVIKLIKAELTLAKAPMTEKLKTLHKNLFGHSIIASEHMETAGDWFGKKDIGYNCKSLVTEKLHHLYKYCLEKNLYKSSTHYQDKILEQQSKSEQNQSNKSF